MFLSWNSLIFPRITLNCFPDCGSKETGLFYHLHDTLFCLTHFGVMAILSATGLTYSRTCVKRPLSKRPKIGFQDQLSLNAGQKSCRMLQGEHSAILLTFIKLPFVVNIFVLCIFEWPWFYTGFTVMVIQALLKQVEWSK